MSDLIEGELFIQNIFMNPNFTVTLL